MTSDIFVLIQQAQLIFWEIWEESSQQNISVTWSVPARAPPPKITRGIRLKEKSLGNVWSCTTNPGLDLRTYFSHLMPPHFKIFFFRTVDFLCWLVCLLHILTLGLSTLHSESVQGSHYQIIFLTINIYLALFVSGMDYSANIFGQSFSDF